MLRHGGNRNLRYAIFGLCSSFIVFAGSCSKRATQSTSPSINDRLNDTLRVATLYSPGSYFIYQGEPMGYDYSLAEEFVNDKGLTLDLHVASNFCAMMQLLDSGIVDLAAYEVPLTTEYLQSVVECGPRTESYQVLVQRCNGIGAPVNDETQLIGRDIYVEEGSKYYHRLVNLDHELGGGIKIHTVGSDSIITEDLIALVARDSIPLTVVDNNIALINRTYYPDIDVSLRLSFPQRSSWAVAPSRRWLADSIDAWLSLEKPRQSQKRLLKRYFEMSKGQTLDTLPDFTRGHISPYDNLFRSYASKIDYDWRMLVSQAYVESHFDSTLVSWAGARGIMQVMPGTARAYGTEPEQLVHPKTAIATSTRIIADLEKSLTRYIDDPDERMKFVLGAYNSGVAHVYDAIALAEKHGYDPTVWDGNVAECLLLKSNPEYYNDTVCRFGYFRGRQTLIYVDHVLTIFEQAKKYFDQ